MLRAGDRRRADRKFRRRFPAVALRWIGEGLIHFVAAMRTTREAAAPSATCLQSGCRPVRRRKARALFQDNPLAAFEGDSCRTFRKSKLNCLRRAASAFSFSKDSPRWPSGKNLHLNAPNAGAGPPRCSTGPGLRAPHREHRRSAPPVPGIEGSPEAARTMARPWPGASLRQSSRTRRVWTLWSQNHGAGVPRARVPQRL